MKSIEEVLASDEAQIIRMIEMVGPQIPSSLRGNVVHPAAQAVTAHLSAILADVETVEAVACALSGFDVTKRYDDVVQQAINEALDDARSAIAVISSRLGCAL